MAHLMIFPDANNNIASFKFKQKITAKTIAGGTIDVEIMVSLKYFSNFCRNFEMPSINLPTVKIKDYNVKVNEQNFFGQPVKTNLRTNDKCQKIVRIVGITREVVY